MLRQIAEYHQDSQEGNELNPSLAEGQVIWSVGNRWKSKPCSIDGHPGAKHTFVTHRPPIARDSTYEAASAG